jgi:hypothetical protein
MRSVLMRLNHVCEPEVQGVLRASRTLRLFPRNTLWLVLSFVFLGMMCGPAHGDPGWTITQLTNNDTEDLYPAISGTNVVWQGYDGSDYEIYSNFAGQLTSNSFNDLSPAISGMNVAWMGLDGDDSEIYMATYVPVPGVALLGVLGLGTAAMRLRRRLT